MNTDPGEAMLADLAKILRESGDITHTWSRYARSFHSALSAAGWVLLPPGGETREQFGVLYVDGFRATVDRAGARTLAAVPGTGIVSVDRRTAITWPDGSSWTGPWTVVTEEETDA